MATYQTIVLLNLSRWENPNKPGTGYSVDVVQTVVDGKNKGVGVEKVYFKDGGDKRIGKPLFGQDLNRVWEHRVEIKALMDNPPPVPQAPEPGALGQGSSLGAMPLESAPMEQSEF